jgi:hypothetical protein
LSIDCPPINLDGVVTSAIPALRFSRRYCGVPYVRLIPRDSQALILNLLRRRLEIGFLRIHQSEMSSQDFIKPPESTVLRAKLLPR